MTAAERKRAQRERDKKKQYEETVYRPTKSVTLSQAAYNILARHAKDLGCELSDVILAFEWIEAANYEIHFYTKNDYPTKSELLHSALNIEYKYRAEEAAQKKQQALMLSSAKLSEL